MIPLTKSHQTYPPKIEEGFDYAPWVDGLQEMIPEKIAESVKKMDGYKKAHEDMRAIITRERVTGNLNNFDLYFWCLILEHGMIPYEIEKMWLTYWLDVYQKLPIEDKISPLPKPVFIDNREKIDKAKEVPIENFFTDMLRKSGGRLVGKCPFHEEKTGSFFIFDDNHFHCFSCGEHGDVISFIMKLKNLDFKEAIEFLL